MIIQEYRANFYKYNFLLNKFSIAGSDWFLN